MKIIILGAGQVGRTAAYHLAREEANDVTVVDVNDHLLRDLQDRLDIRTVAGSGAHPNILELAGAASADMIVALTNSDEVNMVACQVAWTLFRTRTKIARIRSLAYTGHEALFFDTDTPPPDGAGFPVDVYISPEELVTQYVERLIRYSGALQVLDFADGRVRLVGLKAVRGGPLVGQQLRNLREHLPHVDARVVAIYRAGNSIAPEGDTVIEHEDEVFFLAATEDMRKVMVELRRVDDAVKRVVIAGGGNIGLRLAQRIEDRYQVKIIERDAVRARRIAEILRNSVVLHGDAADEELLIEENIDSAVEIVARLADALHYAHQNQVVHRDIKPANLMFDAPSGELKITDFGIARLTDSGRTRTGVVLGTPSFMSPEQLQGRDITGRSDLFSLAVALYQLLTGQLPFRGDTMPGLMLKIAQEPHPRICAMNPSLAPAFDAFFDRALAKAPADRFDSGASMAQALRDLNTVARR